MRVLKIVTTFSLVNLAWVLFRSPSIDIALQYIGNMFQIWKSGSYNPFQDNQIVAANGLFVLSMFLIVILILGKAYTTNENTLVVKYPFLIKIKPIVQYCLIILIFSLSIYMTMHLGTFGGEGSSFIYFEF